MKKFLFTLVAALMSAAISFGQSTLVATLTHEGTLQTYYGARAFIEAHEAAVSGDVVTLSSGSFTATNITKAITVRGAGMETNSALNTEATFITGFLYLDLPANESSLTFENIYFRDAIINRSTLNSPTFTKCRLSAFEDEGRNTQTMQNANFTHCKIRNSVRSSNNSTASFVGCYVNYPYCGDTGRFTFLQCHVKDVGGIRNSSFTNCIIETVYSNYSYILDSSNSAQWCVGIANNSYKANNVFGNLPSSSPNSWLGYAYTIYKTYQGDNDIENEQFELTDEAKANYKDNVGNEIGMYGGVLPFSAIPFGPRITKCNVSAKSTADGKLSVDIEVSDID